MRTQHPKLNQAFINVLQGRTARWVVGQSPGAGLYTDNVQTCRVIIIFGLKNGHTMISMTHVDALLFAERITDECRYFDTIYDIIYCFKPGSLATLPHADQDVIVSELNKIPTGLTIKSEIMSDNQDVVTARYDIEACDISIELQSSHSFNNIQIINWTNADKIYCMYMLNVMFAQIQSELTYLTKIHKNEATAVSSGVLWNGHMYSITHLCAILEPKVDYQQVMFEGRSFNPPRADDLQPNNTANQILQALPVVDPTVDIEILQKMLSNILSNREAKEIPMHAPHEWNIDSRTKLCAQLYFYIFINDSPNVNPKSKLIANIQRYKCDTRTLFHHEEKNEQKTNAQPLYHSPILT